MRPQFGLQRWHLAHYRDSRHSRDYAETIRTVPCHPALTVFRCRSQEILDARLVLDEEIVPCQPTLAEGRIAHHLRWRHAKRAGDGLIHKTVAWTWKVKLSMSLGSYPPAFPGANATAPASWPMRARAPRAAR